MALRDAHLAHARRATGLTDFGPEDFIEPLTLIFEDLLHDARLSRRGRFITPYYMQRLLRLRLRACSLMSRTALPPPVSPVFILGLPRTGSTLLHELLALHPTLRAPTFRETHSLPRTDAPAAEWLGQQFTRAQVGAVHLLAPAFRRIHRLAALGPHECVSIQATAFRSMQFHAAYRLPRYDTWLLNDCDWTPAYRWHKAWLDMLANAVPTRWVLKAPAHMLSLNALQSPYPDARFVQLHREPAEVLPSMASLSLSLRGISSRVQDTAEIGRDVARLWTTALSRTLEARDADAALDARFLDVPYRSLVTEPLTALERILEFIEVPATPAYRARCEAFLARHPQHKHGRHTYTLEQFGLQAAPIASDFAAYRARYLAH